MSLEQMSAASTTATRRKCGTSSAVDLFILDDFGIDVLDPIESRDLCDLLLERYTIGSIIVTSNRGPDECLATFADRVLAQSAIDRFTSNAYDLVIEGESGGHPVPSRWTINRL